MGLVCGHLGTGGSAGGSCCGGCSALVCGPFRRTDIGTGLTQATLSCEGDPFPGGEGLGACGALKAALVVGLTQSGDHFSLDKGVAHGTLGAEVGLVAVGAVVLLVLAEKASL